MPPVSDRSLLEQGILHSPEFACLPFKTIMGDLFTELNMERTGFFSAVAVASADSAILESFRPKY